MEKEMIDENPRKGAHVLVLPYPVQGHINPMLQFSKRLASKGLKVTIITTTSLSAESLLYQTTVDFVRIFDGYREGEKTDDHKAKSDRLKEFISQSLVELIDQYEKNKIKLNPTPSMIIYDAFMPWVLDVLRKIGLKGAPFFTHSCLVNSINYHAYKGALETPENGSLVSVPAVKGLLLRAEDLPSFVSSPHSYPAITRLVLDRFSNFDQADCLFVNAVDTLETEVLEWMTSQWPVKTIGPAIPSMYLDKRLLDDKDYGLSLFKPETDVCIPWLDARENGSVVYISMGSLASLGEKQMEDMAMGLEKCNKYFLWVVRALEENKLPSNFKERTSKRALIVNWCPQLAVLAHRAVGCFVTHCGWNSTLEAISIGVPIVAFPQWADQPTNAKCIEDFWRVGVRVKMNEDGTVTSEEIKSCILQVTEGEKGKEIQRNASKWMQEVKQAMEEGGSSDRNIQEFVSKLLIS